MYRKYLGIHNYKLSKKCSSRGTVSLSFICCSGGRRQGSRCLEELLSNLLHVGGDYNEETSRETCQTPKQRINFLTQKTCKKYERKEDQS
jgi:hypothetical protein